MVNKKGRRKPAFFMAIYNQQFELSRRYAVLPLSLLYTGCGLDTLKICSSVISKHLTRIPPQTSNRFDYLLQLFDQGYRGKQ